MNSSCPGNDGSSPARAAVSSSSSVVSMAGGSATAAGAFDVLPRFARLRPRRRTDQPVPSVAVLSVGAAASLLLVPRLLAARSPRGSPATASPAAASPAPVSGATLRGATRARSAGAPPRRSLLCPMWLQEKSAAAPQRLAREWAAMFCGALVALIATDALRVVHLAALARVERLAQALALFDDASALLGGPLLLLHARRYSAVPSPQQDARHAGRVAVLW